MFVKFTYLAVLLLAVYSYSASADDNIPPEKLEYYLKIVGVVCVPGLAADKAAIVAECEAMVPKPVLDVFHGCVREAGVTSIDMPIMCYKAGAEREKLNTCLKGREAEAKAHGVVIDQAMKDSYRDKYMGCMAKAL